MFHLQTLELLHWDYCQRVTLPLDGAIITIAGPNGSGKTTLLDALRTCSGSECSGGRTYKTYAPATPMPKWPGCAPGGQPAAQPPEQQPPFSSSLLYADQVTLVCRIERHGGDWVRRYLILDGVHEIEQIAERGDRTGSASKPGSAGSKPPASPAPSAACWRWSRARPTGSARLSPRELLRLVFEVFGDQEVLDRYEQARSHQEQLSREVEQAAGELAHAGQLSDGQPRHQLPPVPAQAARARAPRHRGAARDAVGRDPQRLARRRASCTASASSARRMLRLCQCAARCMGSSRRRRPRASVTELDAERREARSAFDAARDAERQPSCWPSGRTSCANWPMSNPTAPLTDRLQAARRRARPTAWRLPRASDKAAHVQRLLGELSGQAAPPPPEVPQLRRAWMMPASPTTWWPTPSTSPTKPGAPPPRACCAPRAGSSCCRTGPTKRQALDIAAKLRYRHYVVADSSASRRPGQPVLAALKVSAPLPSWLARQLASIQCVTRRTGRLGSAAEWITSDAYYRDGRGGRSCGWSRASISSASALVAPRFARRRGRACGPRG